MFTETKQLMISNKSKVPFTFTLHIPGDKEGDESEFEILPRRYALKEKEDKDIIINFTPKKNTWTYDMVLVVNIDGVGDDMLSIPIRGESKSPKVRIEPPEIIDFGNVFLEYEYEQIITLWNDSNLKAQYKILP
jgi:hydrocephalus-inducing protein